VTTTTHQLLSLDEASQLLGVSRGSVYNLVRRGQLQHVKIGRRSLFDLADVNAFVERSKVKTAPARP
jgi:excisionase family DNA binding protein